MKKEVTFNWQIFWLIIVLLILHDALILGYYITFHKAHTNQPVNDKAFRTTELENFGPAPDFNLPDIDGSPIVLSKLMGKVVMVNFWGTWCKSCCDEMPDMDKVYRKYKDKGFELVGVAIEFDRDPQKRLQKVKRKVKELGVTFTIVMGDDGVVKSFGGKLENFPQAFLIDHNGQIRKRIVGARKEDYWENLVRSALLLQE